VERRGSWLAFGSEQLGQGSLAAIEYLKEHPETLDRIIEAVKLAPVAANPTRPKKAG
jgi:hypothetical protein